MLYKGKINDRVMREIIGTPVKDGGAMNELTVFRMVMTPETGMLSLRVIGVEGGHRLILMRIFTIKQEKS